MAAEVVTTVTLLPGPFGIFSRCLRPAGKAEYRWHGENQVAGCFYLLCLVSMVHQNTTIPIIVKRNVVETAGCRSIVFERPIGFDFAAGDWIDISFEHEQLSGGRTYSVSSSPTEPDVVITFKDGISEIKKRLASLRYGDKACIVQYGNDYKFTLKPHQRSVLIAGGVGIAPFRSMLKELFDTKRTDHVTLLYMNKTPDFLFEPEISLWLKELHNFKAHMIVTEDLNKKSRTKIILDTIGDLSASFYIAGPEGMVESTEHVLLDHGAALKNIKIDSFGGY
jgi:ferredoxin-NADP reductase